MNTSLEAVYDSFMQKVTDYKMLEISQDDYYAECKQLLAGSYARFMLRNDYSDIETNLELNEFNRVLTPSEIEIFALGMIIQWVSPKLNTVELIKMNLSSKDYQTYSQANHIKELLDIKAEANREFDHWVTLYSSQNAIKTLKKGGNA